MRPNKLTVQAFGPFAGSETVDFDRLGSNPLFLINGPTGAGKSSILDGICFALYGQTTGKEREASQMRSDFAELDVLTEVTLDFTFRDERYRIIRSPTQDRSKKTGEGITEHKTAATLFKLDDDEDVLLVPKSAMAATQYITELTGLSVEQFRQVMILPQGKFREFLLADSSEREKIFSTLFQTDIYRRIENSLKQQAAGIRRDVDRLENQIKGLLQAADVSTRDELDASLLALETEVKKAVKDKDKTEQKLAKAKAQLNDAESLLAEFQLLDNNKQQLTVLEQAQDAVEKDRGRISNAAAAQKIEPSFNTLQQLIADKQEATQALEVARSDLEATDKALAEAQSQHTEAQKKAAGLDALKQQLSDLQKLQPKLAELANANRSLLALSSEYKTAQAKHKTADERLKTAIKAIADAEMEMAQLDKVTTALPKKMTELQGLRNTGVQRAELEKQLGEQQALETKFAKSQQNLAAITTQVNAQSKDFDTLSLRWHNNQAALLASKLGVDQPCPVCGSTKHPAPADAVEWDESATKESVEKARQALSGLEQTQARHNAELAGWQQQLAGIKQEIDQLNKQLGAASQKTVVQLRQEYSQLQSETKQLQQQLNLRETRNAELLQKREQLKSLESQRDTARTAETEAHEAGVLAKQTVATLRTELPKEYREPGALEQKIAELNSTIQSISTAFEQAQTALQEAQGKQLTAKTSHKEKSAQLTSLEKRFTDQQLRWQEMLDGSVFANENDFLNARLDEAQRSTIQQSIQTHDDELKACKVRISEQQKRLKDKEAPQLEALQENIAEKQEQHNAAFEHWKQKSSLQDTQLSTHQKLQTAQQNNRDLEAKYAIYGTLSDVANGQTGDKISLQRFVISVFLDDVLIEASHHLHTMSNKRYRLVRKQRRAKGLKASGLELEVEDAYTGKARSVNSLSGGESFMAALALALGLSDRVQSYAGGIQLDTLFIDEGFGSLDQEALDSAIQTLIDLQSSGRMIGIISHVSELREQLSLRVDVEHSNIGSHIAISGV